MKATGAEPNATWNRQLVIKFYLVDFSSLKIFHCSLMMTPFNKSVSRNCIPLIPIDSIDANIQKNHLFICAS
jgi:hypothetical protein